MPSIPNAVTLADALALALEHNPQLQVFDAEVRAAEARVLQAGRWSNPEVEAEIERFAGSGEFSGTERAETTISLAQVLPLGRDVARRREVAETMAELKNWDYRTARVDVLKHVTQRFVRVLAAERRLVLARHNLELAETTARITSERVAAGDASPIEESWAVVPVVTAKLNVNRAIRTRDAALHQLSRTWGVREQQAFSVEGSLDAIRTPPPVETLVSHINQHPKVARWAEEIALRTAEREHAEAMALPDMTARFGIKQEEESGNSALVVGIAFPLPLFDQQRDAIRAAEWDEEAATLRQREAELGVEMMLNDVYVRLINAYEEAMLLRNKGLPAVHRAYEGTRTAFNEGKLHFLEVLDAQRTLFDVKRDYITALANYHIAQADIEALISTRMPNFHEPPGLSKGELP